MGGFQDWSSVGAEGTLPVDFVPWQRGVTCTVRPEWLAPIEPQRTYFANVTVQRATPLSERLTDYGSLYKQAMSIVGTHQLDRAGLSKLHTWVQAHAWFRLDLPNSALVSATVTLGVSANDDASTPAGEPPPSVEDLRHPSGQTPESFAAKHETLGGQRRVDHLYTDFDRTDGSSRDITLSYGEYADDVPSDYGSFLERAERFVRSYDASLELLMREWRATKTDKATDLPWIIVGGNVPPSALMPRTYAAAGQDHRPALPRSASRGRLGVDGRRHPARDDSALAGTRQHHPDQYVSGRVTRRGEQDLRAHEQRVGRLMPTPMGNASLGEAISTGDSPEIPSRPRAIPALTNLRSSSITWVPCQLM